FRGRVVDVGADSVIVEITGDEDKVSGLVDLLRPRGVLEMVRTGKGAMLRGSASAEARTTAEPAPGTNGRLGRAEQKESSNGEDLLRQRREPGRAPRAHR